MDRERVQLWASVAEIVSAVAIVVSLLYVGSEFRQSQTLSERDADVRLFESVRETNRILIENPDIARIVVEAAADPAALSEVDRVRYLAYQHLFFDNWEIAWGYHEDEVLGDELWGEWDGWFGGRAAALPRFAWEATRVHFSGAFRGHVDRRLGPPGVPATSTP